MQQLMNVSMTGGRQHHLKRDMTAAAAVGQPQMNRAAAKASAQESLQGRPKFTGFAAISQGRSLGAAPLIRPESVEDCLSAQVACCQEDTAHYDAS